MDHILVYRHLSLRRSKAQCLYVLTDDNLPASREVKFNAAYLSYLAGIVQEGISGKGKNVAADERAITLRVLAAGELGDIYGAGDCVAHCLTRHLAQCLTAAIGISCSCR